MSNPSGINPPETRAVPPGTSINKLLHTLAFQLTTSPEFSEYLQKEFETAVEKIRKDLANSLGNAILLSIDIDDIAEDAITQSNLRDKLCEDTETTLNNLVAML